MHGSRWGKGMLCGHCLSSPCVCGGMLHGMMKKCLAMGAHFMGWKKAMWAHEHPMDGGWCQVPCDADIVVHALPGERRIVPFVVKNDSQCPITVTPRIGPWSECGCEDQPLDQGPSPQLVPPDPATIPPCGAHSFDIVIETGGVEQRVGLKPCHCYCATLLLDGSCCGPVKIALCIGGKRPAVCHHDVSKLRAWVHACCFEGGGPGYIAPAPLAGPICHDGHHGCCR